MIGLMAKKKRSRDRGEVRPIGVELTPRIADALQKCSEQEQRTKKAIITRALEMYLKAAGLWPPADQD